MPDVYPAEDVKPHVEDSSQNSDQLYFEKKTADGKVELTEDAAPQALGFSFSPTKKWFILIIISIVQISMNFNASIYANAVDGMSEEFEISAQAARVGQAIFLIAYGFGCELWAPWSEELGRWYVLQASLFLVNIFAIMAAVSPNIGCMLAARFLGGLSSAGGSVTLGLVADLYDVNNHAYALAAVVFSSTVGSIVGAIVGGFIKSFSTWRWIFWIQVIFGFAAQALHLLVPETRSTVMLDKEAKRRRKEAAKEGRELNIWGPGELHPYRFDMKKTVAIWLRPFYMLIQEPIVLSCSALSFSDMLIFIKLESYGLVLSQWGFQPWASGLGFVAIFIGYIIGWVSFIPSFRSQDKRRKNDPQSVTPEDRLWWLLWTAPLLPIGLFMFSWTALGPDYSVHWIGPMISAAVVAIANYNIYLATGGNGFARDVLAGISAMFADPFYHHFSTYTLEIPTTILACIAVVLVVPVMLLYFYGPAVRKHSKFAEKLAEGRETTAIKSQVRDEKQSRTTQGRFEHVEEA